MTGAVDDGFQTATRRPRKQPRLYIGNLPPTTSVDHLVALLSEHGFNVQPTDVELNSNKNPFALVAGSDVDAVRSRLHRKEFQGRRLVVQRERKRTDKSPWQSSWSKPVEVNDDAVHVVGAIVEEAMTESEDPMTTLVATTAAVSLATEAGTFSALMNQPMSSLLADYGEQDLEWDKKAVSIVETEPKQPPASRLGQHGKAPIHVDLVSFGYHHGAPEELRHAWSHAQPLPAFDTRDVTEVPGYLGWMDGLSGAVKRELRPLVVETARDVADQVSDCLVEAINAGGHGYALPLHMTIYVGSETGRHRSVVAVEVAASELRRRLRQNANDRFAAPISVGTRHRDVDSKASKSPSGKPKQKDLEDDW